MIKNQLEQTLQNIRAERESQIVYAQDRVMNDVILKNNAKIDELRDNALAELNSKQESELTELHNRYEQKKREIINGYDINKNDVIARSEDNKKKFEQEEISKATATTTMQYDKTISDLETLIANIKE